MDRLIKLISADGLTGYEHPHPYYTRPNSITRVITPQLRAMTIETADLKPYQLRSRTYTIQDSYFDRERGYIVDVYKEDI